MYLEIKNNQTVNKSDIPIGSFKNLKKDLDLKNHISNTQIWQFIAYSNKDSTIPQESVEDYIKAAKDKGVNMTRIFIPDQEHGFLWLISGRNSGMA